MIKIAVYDSSPFFLLGITNQIRESRSFEVVSTYSTRDEFRNGIAESNADIVIFDAADFSINIHALVGYINKYSDARLLAFISDKIFLYDDLIMAGVHGILLKSCSTRVFMEALKKLSKNELWLDYNSMCLTRYRKLKSSQITSILNTLTPKDQEILSVISESSDMPFRQLARKLFISEKTLKNHLTSLYTKTHVHNYLALQEISKQLISSKPSVAAVSNNPSRCKVLIVEDQERLCELSANMLRRIGCNVAGAITAEDALNILDESEFDVLFTDICLPGGMNGLELANTITDRYPHIKIILTSGLVEPDAISESWLFLAKPYLMRDLESVFNKLPA